MAERLGATAHGRVLAAVHGAVHLRFPSGVVSVTAADVPLMGNAVRAGVPAHVLGAVPAGAPAELGPRGVRAGSLDIPFGAPPPVGRTRVPPWTGPPVPVDAAALPALAARLVGRGGGLTPEGDDLLAGVALALVARGRRGDAALLVPGDLERRTGALPATLLRLAARGHGPEAAVRMLAGDEARRAAAARELARLGGSTGAAVARGVAAILDRVPLDRLAVPPPR